jgi:predicted Zn finger-like uncharacterized protein
MKFLCPSCKAKYQIADEKVSGRSVRMKCRKCGFIIPISEVPPAPPSLVPGVGIGPLPEVPKAPPPPVLKETPARTPPSPATRDTRSPASAPGHAKPPARRPTLSDVKVAPTKPPGSAPRSAGAPGIGVPPPKAAPVRPAAVSAKPAPVAAAQDFLGTAFEEEEDEQTRMVSGGALAAAFGQLVSQEPEAPANDARGMPADEWFVGINEVPVGPIRLSEIRKRAMLGAITADSLVWRDGLEAWRPLRTFPELVAVLEESMSSVRASTGPLVAPSSRAEGSGSGFSPGGITSTAVVTDDLAMAGLPRRGTPAIAWVAVVVALGFGVAIGFFFFSKQKPPETIVKYVEVAAKGGDQPIAAAAQPDQGDVDPAMSAKPGSKRPSGKGAGTNGTTGDKGSTDGGLAGLKGLSGLSPGGPGTPGGSTPGTTPGGGGGQLDAAQIQSTVSRYTGAVKRRCWQPALDGRDPSAPSTARVVVTIGVTGSGSVQSVSTSGDPRGYPGLSNCIASSVRAWTFPATGGSSTAVVPFVFAAQ